MSLALRDVLQADRRLAVDVMPDPNFLADDKLFDYQVAVLNFRNEKPLTQEQRTRDNLLKFVEQGRGLIAIHYASGAFAGWDRFDEIIGKTMNPMPRHDPIGMVTVQLLDLSHPITRDLSGFQVRDELYTSVEGDQPTTTLAVARSAVTGNQHPVAFVGNFGRGRYFHYTLGHNPQAIRTPAAANCCAVPRCGWPTAPLQPVATQQPVCRIHVHLNRITQSRFAYNQLANRMQPLSVALRGRRGKEHANTKLVLHRLPRELACDAACLRHGLVRVRRSPLHITWICRLHSPVRRSRFRSRRKRNTWPLVETLSSPWRSARSTPKRSRRKSRTRLTTSMPSFNGAK